jgi:hypothetical protein
MILRFLTTIRVLPFTWTSLELSATESHLDPPGSTEWFKESFDILIREEIRFSDREGVGLHDRHFEQFWKVRR